VGQVADGPETTKWFSKMLTIGWPVYRENVRQWFLEKFENWFKMINHPKIEYLRVKPNTLKMSLDPPQISTIDAKAELMKPENSEIAIDLQILFASPLSVDLELKLAGFPMTITITVEMHSLHGNLRVNMEYIDRFPFIGVLTFFFTEQPEISIAIRPAGAIDLYNDLPWLSNVMQDSIMGIIKTNIVLNKIILPFGKWMGDQPEEEQPLDHGDASLLDAAHAEGLLEVQLLHISHTKNSTKWTNGSKPRCILKLLDNDGAAMYEDPKDDSGETLKSEEGRYIPEEDKFEFPAVIHELMVKSYDLNVLQIQVVEETVRRTTSTKKKVAVIGTAFVRINHLTKEGMTHEQNLELETDDEVSDNAGYLQCKATYRAKHINNSEDYANIRDHAVQIAQEGGSIDGLLLLFLEQVTITEGMQKSIKNTDLTSRMFCTIRVAAEGKPAVMREKTTEVSTRNQKGEIKVASFNEQFKFKVKGDEELKIFLVKRSKLSKDYCIAEWRMRLEDHLPNLLDSLPHDYRLESELPTKQNALYPNPPAPIKFKVWLPLPSS